MIADLDAVASVAAVLIWVAVVGLAVYRKADLVLLALVLIILGFLGTQLLAVMGVRGGFSWAFSIVGVALIFLWPRHDGRPH